MFRYVMLIGLLAFSVAASKCRKDQEGVWTEPEGSIVISRNYAAEWNAATLAIPEAERAWTSYREVAIGLTELPEELIEADWPVERSHPLFPTAVEHLRENDKWLETIRDASKRPAMGYVLSDQLDPLWEIGRAAKEGREPEIEPPSENPALFELSLHHLGHARHMARLMLMDTRSAIVDLDRDRAARNIDTMFNIAGHAIQSPSPVSKLVGVVIGTQAIDAISECAYDAPELLTDDQWRVIDARLAAYDPDAWMRASFVEDAAYFQDFLQRACTDDGHGSGTFTSEGLRLLDRFSESNSDDVSFRVRLLRGAAERREMLEEYLRVHEIALGYFDQPMRAWEESPQLTLNARLDAEANKWSYFPVNILMPAFGKLAVTVKTVELRRDAARAAIALARYRLEHGVYPKALVDLVPGYLSCVPIDSFDGEPLRYSLDDGRPMLYTVGTDRTDDAGKPTIPRGEALRFRSTDEVRNWRLGVPGAPEIHSGDWVFYPRRISN